MALKVVGSQWAEKQEMQPYLATIRMGTSRYTSSAYME